MKKDKWRKWKLGAGGAVAVFFIFQSVKDSPAFMQAEKIAQLSNNTSNNTIQNSQPLYNGNFENNGEGYFDDNSNGGYYGNGGNNYYGNSNNYGNNNYYGGQFTPQRSHTRTGRS